MKVIKLQAENTLNFSAFEIIPDDDAIILTGKNGAGKSNVLIIVGIIRRSRLDDHIKRLPGVPLVQLRTKLESR